LGLDNNNVDAMVARGAALANLKQFDRAIRQLENALKVDQHHVNAKKYLQIIEEKLNAERLALSKTPKSNRKSGADEVYALLLAEKKEHKSKHKSSDHKKSKSKRKEKRSSHKNSKDSPNRGRSPTKIKSSRDKKRDKTLSPCSVQERKDVQKRNKLRQGSYSKKEEPPTKRNKLH